MLRAWSFLLASLTIAAQQNEQRPSYQPNWPCTGKEKAFDPAYLRTAEATGGQLFLLDRSEVGAFTVMATNQRNHSATVARSVGTLQSYRDIRVPVDPSVESLYIAGSLQCMQRIVIYDPLNAESRPEIGGGEDHVYHAGRISVVSHPTPGVWTVRLLGSGAYSLVVQARTTLALHDLRFETPEQISVYVNAPTPAIRFRLVDEAGDNLQTLSLESAPPGSGRYDGPFTRPSRKFRVMVEGSDEQGNVFFQRADPRLFEP